jgi:hypothetical protein
MLFLLTALEWKYGRPEEYYFRLYSRYYTTTAR